MFNGQYRLSFEAETVGWFQPILGINGIHADLVDLPRCKVFPKGTDLLSQLDTTRNLKEWMGDQTSTASILPFP